MRVRHAEACKRAGDRLQAIASYRAAAELLLELGCESRARGALKAALELDPRDPLLQADVARLGPHYDEKSSGSLGERDELPLLPPLEPNLEPVPPPPAAAPRPVRGLRHDALSQTPALPKILRALPVAPSVGPPVLLPAPGVPSTASATPAPITPPRSATTRFQPPAIAPVTPPVLHPRSATTGLQAREPQASATPLPRAVSTGAQAPTVRVPTPTPLPPPPPEETLLEKDLGASLARSAASMAPEPSQDARPRLEVRRLSSNTLAFRSSPNDSWALIRSHTPLEMHLVDDLEKLPPMMRDLTPEIMVEASAEEASPAMH